MNVASITFICYNVFIDRIVLHGLYVMSDTNTDFIYGLFDLYAGQFFYVGVTNNLEHRFNTHVGSAQKAIKKGLKYIPPVQAYIAEMLEREQMPTMTAIESYPANRYRTDAHMAESFWIHHLKQAGHPIVNTLGANRVAKDPLVYERELARRNLAVGRVQS